jgi:RNA polymerase sigma-70 factor (ECF subfamily)
MDGQTIDFAGLYSAERGRLKRLITRLVGNRAATDDLVQQAFVKLMAAAESGRIENCAAYLTTTVGNLARNHLRDLGRRGEVDLKVEDLHALPDRAPSPEMVAIHRRELRRVLAAVATLPPRRREAFVLNKFEGMTYDEIAVRQGVSRNTVITHIVLALADLDRRLGGR